MSYFFRICIRAITNLQGFNSIDIVSPEMMFQEAENDEIGNQR